MRTVYLGTSPFAVAVLERLAASPHRPALVVTRPDRPRGRGRRLAAPPVAEAASALGIDVFQPDSVNSEDARARIDAAAPDEVVICAFGALIREPLLSAHPMLNVHPSLLPRWRGAAPIERAIDAGDARTGVCIMRPVAEMDAGPICRCAVEPIRPDDDFGSLSARLARVGAELLVDVLDQRPPCRAQPGDGVTIAPKIERGDRLLDAGRSAAELERRVRALSPHVGAMVDSPEGSEEQRLVVRRARALDPGALPAPGGAPAPGALVGRGGRLLLGARDGALELLEVIPPGGRAMSAGDFLRGRGAALVAG